LSSFSELARGISPTSTDFDSAAKRYNRLTEHYAVAHGLCKMFIFGLRPESFFHAGPQKVFGVVLDMVELFEMFMQRLLEDSLGPKGFVIKSQCPDRGALLDAEDKRYSSVRPDFLICRADQVVAVVDAKYKDYWSSAVDGARPQRKMANEDVYQLFFYQQRLQRIYDLPTPPAAVVASPLPAEDERGGKLPISGKFREVKWRVGTDIAGHLHLALIPMTGFLRLLEQKKSIQEALSVSGVADMTKLFLL